MTTNETYSLTDDRDCLYVAGIEEESIVDGPGIRFTIFLQGCMHHCPKCHNPESWDYSPDTLEKLQMNFDILIEKIKKNKLITGITLSGGDPILQHDKLIKFIDKLRESGVELPIMLYTGYLFEEIQHLDLIKKRYVESIMDGPFIQDQKSLDIPFRGSKNQRWWIRKVWFSDWSPNPEDNGAHIEYMIETEESDIFNRKNQYPYFKISKKCNSLPVTPINFNIKVQQD